ncbi:hypothetical protein AB0D27_27540 [Streptomyces sp. NPDC048415]|uniref:hypothetical protein n=1 Tax=Streptomyces sp. NPDC048415 TaxID=3154822 RepID=UPI003429B4B5
MRRTACVLSATALAGVALGAAASAAFADPAAEVSPGSVEPGGTVTISVTCDAMGAGAPEFIDAASQGFEDGKVHLRRVEGNDENAAGAAYRGTAHIPPGGNSEDSPDAVDPESQWGVDGVCPVAPGGQEKAWTASYTVAHGSADTHSAPAHSSAAQSADVHSTDVHSTDAHSADEQSADVHSTDAPADEQPPDVPSTGTHSTDAHSADEQSADVPSTDVHSADEQSADTHSADTHSTDAHSADEQSADVHSTDTHSADEQSADAHSTGERPPPVQQGVHAGEGGAFTDSLPALIAGSILIAGALGAAVHRLLRGGRSAGG